MSLPRTAILLLTSLVCAAGALACSRTVADNPTPPVAPTSAPAPVVAPTNTADAVALLRKASRFEDTHVGYGGELSVYVAAFRVVLADPSAKEHFNGLVDDATIAGKLYGAAGLYFADPPAFDAALAKLSSAGGDVMWQRGCMVDQEKVADVIRSKEKNRIEVEKGKTLRAWFDTNKDGGHDDLAGGAIPLSFVSDERPAPRGPVR